MNTRGRKSAASLVVVSSAIPQRMEAPSILSLAQAAIWVKVVNTKPVDWFAEDSAPILIEYVRAVDTCNMLAPVISQTMAEGDPKAIKEILKVRDTEAKRAADLATKLRLTQQSRYTPQAAATANKKSQNAAKPWEFTG